MKKAVLRVNSHNARCAGEELERMLKEVRLLAEIQDVHIVRYNSSWLERTEEALTPDCLPSSSRHEPTPDVALVSPFIGFANKPDNEDPCEHKGVSEDEAEDEDENRSPLNVLEQFRGDTM